MRLKTGSRAIEVVLPDIDGKQFSSNDLKGKSYLLTFYRFASCPFCNLRVNEMVKKYNELPNDFTIVAIFDSPVDNLARYTEGHHAPFHILADEKGEFYDKYAIEYSMYKVLKGLISKLPALLKAMLKGYLPTRFKGSLATMPADFLIDKDGIIQQAYYGNDQGDHLSFEEIKAFSLGSFT
jgi:peroxiredoxin